MTDALDATAALLGPLVVRDEPLAPLTTYRVGGRSALFARVEHEADLETIAAAVRATGIATLVVGRGSNLLVADEGFSGLAIQLGSFATAIDIVGSAVTAGAAVLLPVLARRTAAASLSGLEWAVGVPGSVGGAVRMNAGGHGSDVAASLRSVDLARFARGAFERGIPASRLGLRFRGSDLRDDDVVVRATFDLSVGERDRSEADIAEIVRWRREHQPGGQNAGSVFVNPVPGVLAAGELIDALGLRGFRIGSAHVSEKHANFIQADEGGSAADVLAVIDAVHARVAREHGIELRSEVRLVGFTDRARATTGTADR